MEEFYIEIDSGISVTKLGKIEIIKTIIETINDKFGEDTLNIQPQNEDKFQVVIRYETDNQEENIAKLGLTEKTYLDVINNALFRSFDDIAEARFEITNIVKVPPHSYQVNDDNNQMIFNV